MRRRIRIRRKSDMKHNGLFLAALTLSACNPAASKAPKPNGDAAPKGLMFYEASEFEPSWSLTLTDGKLIKFRQLNPNRGKDFITDSYRVKYQTGSVKGFTIHAAGEKGDFIFSTMDVRGQGGCTHSGSGATHRDKVTVASPRKTWVGCGGPEL